MTPTCDNFDDALAEVHAAGYVIQNLFQRDSGGWQANLRAEGAKTYSEFGIASTPHGAMLAALVGAEPVRPKPVAPIIAPVSLFD